MNTRVNLIAALSIMFLIGCGGKEEKKEGFSIKNKKTDPIETKAVDPKTSSVPASKRIDLTNKGVGQITNLELAAEIDGAMATKGEELYKINCTACHRTHKKFIGPAPVNILERRTPEWVMNMILDPEKMVAEDPLAKDLLIEHNVSPMSNQSLNEEEARAILEYFRTLKEEN